MCALAPPQNIRGVLYKTMLQKLTQEEFLQRARAKHGDKYDYSLVEYDGKDSIITIICPKHGPFQQKAGDHTQGCGCKLCGYDKLSAKKRHSQDQFLASAKRIHGDRYDLSEVAYCGNKRLITIICKKHGPFQMTPSNFLNGQNCPKCKMEKRRKDIYFGVGIDDVGISRRTPLFMAWHGMLTRCYSELYHKQRPTYIGCSVCEEWKHLSGFKRWFDTHYRDGYALDKDIIKKGNKIYSPDTCAFVPVEINGLLVGRKKNKEGCPVGVSKVKGKERYDVHLSPYGRIGQYSTVEAAFSAYVIAKERRVKEVAQEYYNENKIERRVYDALMNYKVEITD